VKYTVDNQYKKNRITIIVIFAMSIVPFGFAWFLAKNPDIVKLGTNNGALISPPKVTSADDFSGYDSFSAQNMNELKGHWVLVNPVPKNCEETCRDALYKTHQLTLMMGKDIARIRRLAVVFEKSYQLPAEWRDDGRLLKVLPSLSLREKLTQLNSQPSTEGMLIIMDPLGNLMMQYPSGYDPYQVKSDLGKLLRISQIG
jgi:hypothetical protein